jgi:phosphatidylinositol alpha-1,6-mannosyltransferase
MITELYLPTKGGTAVMFEDDCRRLGGKSVHIVTAAVEGGEDFDRDHPNTVHRLVLERKPWLRPESLVMYSRLLARSMQLAFRHRFVAVLAGRALPEGLVAWAVARVWGCKLIVYAHGEELTGWGRGRKFDAMCFTLRHADHVVANSDFTRDILISLVGVRPERIVMAYPVVDAERFVPGLPHDDLRRQIGLADAQHLVLSVGRLQRRKGFDQVVRALAVLEREGLDVHYTIVGIGEDRDYLLGLARGLGVLPRLHLLGHVDPNDLPRWYNACDLFAMPNREINGDTEGFGIVYLEANACAKPAIAGAAGGTGSAVEDGVNGLRVEGTRVEAVADAIASLLLDGALAARMGAAGRERVMARFTPARRTQILRDAIASRRPGPALGAAAPPKPQRPLRILMYTAYLDPEYSGASLQALTLARELRRRGHTIKFITNRWLGRTDGAIVDGFEVRRLEPGRLRKHREFRLWLNLARHVWAHRGEIDILHGHGAYYTHAFIGPLARLLGLKSLVKASLAHDDLESLSRPLVGSIHRTMLRRIDACVAISRDLVDEFAHGGIAPERIHYLPNGVDTGRFRPADKTQVPALRQALGLPPGQPIALYVGVMDQRKNILWLAEQWVAHDAFGTGALLLAVGPQAREDEGGQLRNRFAELARAHPQLLALRDFSADVLPYYQCVSTLVLPSVREGLPNVVLEAMACGLPCVAARASGSRELIVDGENGFTYEPGSTGELAAALRQCLSPTAAALGAAGRVRAQADYSIQAIASRYEALYTQIVRR